MTEIVTTRPGGQLQLNLNPRKLSRIITTLKHAVEAAAQKCNNGTPVWKRRNLLVEWEREFVAWWNTHVLACGTGLVNNQHKRLIADQRSTITKDDAERKPKSRHRRFPRWRNGLKRPDYAARIIQPGAQKGDG